MSDNKTILTTRRFELWWRKAQAWFATQFASINFKPVEDKIDEVKDAVDNIDFSAIAKQGSNPNASLTVVDNKIGTAPVGSDKDTIFAWLTTIYEYLAGQDPEEIPEGLGDRINLLLQFFGLPQALPEYQSIPLLEMTGILEDIMTTIDSDLTAEEAAAITEEVLSSDSSDDSSD